jgi:hypothetical protein
MPLFVYHWVLLFKQVALGCLNELGKVEKLFLA